VMRTDSLVEFNAGVNLGQTIFGAQQTLVDSEASTNFIS
jgi:hypothetical protein